MTGINYLKCWDKYQNNIDGLSDLILKINSRFINIYEDINGLVDSVQTMEGRVDNLTHSNTLLVSKVALLENERKYMVSLRCLFDLHVANLRLSNLEISKQYVDNLTFINAIDCTLSSGPKRDAIKVNKKYYSDFSNQDAHSSTKDEIMLAIEMLEDSVKLEMLTVVDEIERMQKVPYSTAGVRKSLFKARML